MNLLTDTHTFTCILLVQVKSAASLPPGTSLFHRSPAGGMQRDKEFLLQAGNTSSPMQFLATTGHD